MALTHMLSRQHRSTSVKVMHCRLKWQFLLDLKGYLTKQPINYYIPIIPLRMIIYALGRGNHG